MLKTKAIVHNVRSGKHNRLAPRMQNIPLPFFFMSACALIAGITVLFFPADAFAWGPGVHMVTGNWVLQNLSALPMPVAAALMQFPGQFLHGCLSADIFIGKGSKAKENHSHNWSSGLVLLERARTLRRQAYAYGYLAHLAADTVAHNVFVPSAFHTAPGAGRLAHVYLEIQADRLLSWDTTDAVGVFHEAGSRGSALMLRDTLNQKALSFWLKKHMFEGSIALGGSKVWRTSMQLLDKLLPQHERENFVREMLTISTRAIFSLLADPSGSPVRSLDPIGADALAKVSTAYSKRWGTRIKGMFVRPAPGLSSAMAAASRMRNTILPEALLECPEVCVFDMRLPTRLQEVDSKHA